MLQYIYYIVCVFCVFAVTKKEISNIYFDSERVFVIFRTCNFRKVTEYML